LLTDAVNNGDNRLICYLGDYYKNIENNNFEANKYYLLAILKNEKEGLGRLEKNTTPRELFLGLYMVKKNNELINKKINIMKDKLTIRALHENLVKNEQNLKDCPECGRKDVQHLQFNCKHEVCRYCFVDMADCPFRCFIHTNNSYKRKYYKNYESNGQ